MAIVCGNSDKKSCIALSRDGGFVSFIPKLAIPLALCSLPEAEFDALWSESEYPVKAAAEKYLEHKEGLSPEAEEVLRALLASLPEISPEGAATVAPDASPPSPAPSPDTTVGAASPSRDDAVSAEVVQAAPGEAKEPVKAAPSKGGRGEMLTLPVISGAPGLKLEMTENGLMLEIAQPAVHKMQSADFAGKAQAVTESAEMKFYVALNAAGLIERNVSVAGADRQNIAALVANWIAEGFLVESCDTRDLIRHLRRLDSAARKSVGAEQSESASA